MGLTDFVFGQEAQDCFRQTAQWFALPPNARMITECDYFNKELTVRVQASVQGQPYHASLTADMRTIHDHDQCRVIVKQMIATICGQLARTIEDPISTPSSFWASFELPDDDDDDLIVIRYGGSH